MAAFAFTRMSDTVNSKLLGYLVLLTSILRQILGPVNPIFTQENPPVASFIIRAIYLAGDRICLVHPEVIDKQMKTYELFFRAVDINFATKLIIDFEFLDLKIASPNDAAPCSIWGLEDMSNLKEAYEASLIRNIDKKNALKMLEKAYLCGLPNLKTSCLTYLFKFGRVFDMGNDFSQFLQSSDRELAFER